MWDRIFLQVIRPRRGVRRLARLSLIGVALGVGALVVALSILDGFGTAYRDGLLGAQAPLMVLREDEQVDRAAVEAALADVRATTDVASTAERRRLHRVVQWRSWRELAATAAARLGCSESCVIWLEGEGDGLDAEERARAVHGVTRAAPFLYREGLIVGNGVIRGALLRGIDPTALASPGLAGACSRSAGAAESIEQPRLQLTPTTETEPLASLTESTGDLPLLVGRALAEQLGDGPVSLFLPGVTDAVSGPSLHSARIVGRMSTGLHDLDTQLVYTDLRRLQHLYQRADTITGYDLWLDDVNKSPWIADALRDALGPAYLVVEWRDLHRDTFAALAMEKLLLGLVMGILILIAVANIGTTVILQILDRYQTVAVLRVLGMTPRQLRRLYTWRGLQWGLTGTFAGLLLGSGIVWSLGRWHWFRLPAEVYFIPHVPAEWSLSTCIVVFALGLACSAAAAWTAARNVTRLPILQALGRGYV